MHTNFSLLTTEQKTVWSMDMWKQARNYSFVNKFLGNGSNSMIQHITELKKSEKGARAVITLLADLEGCALQHDVLYVQADVGGGLAVRGRLFWGPAYAFQFAVGIEAHVAAQGALVGREIDGAGDDQPLVRLEAGERRAHGRVVGRQF